MYITRLRVQNFRSIVDIDIELSHYTALVGLNDSGKSNLLRALNLFFNGQTDSGYPLNFDQDFSQLAKDKVKKAKEIEIELELMPPKNYADSGPVKWKKIFRADSTQPYHEELERKDGQPFSKGSRVEYWVRRITFEYVPAIRGRHFFSALKRRLYTTLAETVSAKLNHASRAFLSDLRREVKDIESESLRLLQLKTEFSLPADLGSLFEVLDFEAADDHASTALQYRGDGIQGRHVPLILKFLSDQRKVNSAKGKPVPETIWGFEEPENNLELAKQVDVAGEFGNYSKAIQIVVSTHSPAFYSQAKHEGQTKIVAREGGVTRIVDEMSAEVIDKHVGLMPFIEPYIEKAAFERNEMISQLRSIKASTLLTGHPALYVEGSSDRTILNAAFKMLHPGKNFEIVAKDGLNGGTAWVVGCCIARAAMVDQINKTAALLDDDGAGKTAISDIQDKCKAIGKSDQIKAFVVGRSNADDEFRKMKQSGILVSYGIEEICGVDAWLHAEAKGWLQERGVEVTVANARKLGKTMSLSDLIEKKVTDGDVRRMIEYKVSDTEKGSFAKYVSKQIHETQEVPPTLKILVNEIAKYFA